MKGSPVPDKDLVRKIRPAFAGVPDDALFDKHLLVWSDHDALCAGFISDVPDVLLYKGSIYRLQQPYVGDWDPLLNPSNHLVGFSFPEPEDEAFLQSAFVQQHKQIIFAGGWLQIVLASDREFNSECVQGLGTRLFADSKGDYLFLFPQWLEDWGNVGFPLRSTNMPSALDTNAGA